MSRFWAVGVGPGDPELLTLKALNVLQAAQRIYHAGPGDDQGRALAVVRPLLRPDQPLQSVLSVSMSLASASPNREAYRHGVESIAADLRRGLNVAFITEGDPTLYSTAPHVWELLRELHPEAVVEVVPGVCSITAAAALASWPLAQRGQTLRIVPAGYHADQLRSMLESDASICLLKPGKALAALVDFLEEQGPRCEAAYIEELGTDRQWVTRDLAQAVGRQKYFSLVLLRRKLTEVPSAAADRPSKVWALGLGPGDPALLTRQALRVLREASDIVGYEGYLKRLEPLGLRAACHARPIGAEAERAALALDLARQGRQVALVSSGDPGVYGMASLLLESAGQAPDIPVEIVPGVTAATAAAACLGAPLGHDFACISLSDLLTPWPVIERRLEAAGRADFVVALYNPASQERTWQLPRARDILRKHRPATTPLGLVTGAYRDGMSVRLTTLGELTSDGVTMETLVVVGNSQTRVLGGRLVTPRGYHYLHTSRARPEPSEPGRRILEESLAIIERELGPHSFPHWAFAVVRRIIHASADFEYAQTIRYSADFEMAARQALQGRVPVITDTEMVQLGIRGSLGDSALCYLHDPEATALAATAGLTRSAAGIRVAARRHPAPLLALGNAPTAVEEALRLVEEESWRPAALIAIPVGFIGVEEAKRHLQAQTHVPYVTCVGRKGGSAVTAAAVNALAELFALKH
jgi:precorrin-2 C(20)-methyltransferase